jgi:CubicO group peptidase (beta-lactamase class C family)
MKKTWMLAVVALGLTSGYAQDSSRLQPGSITVQQVDVRIERWLKKKNVPGLAACIVKDDKIVWANGYGWANIEKKIPFTPDKTLFHIASISKTITATAIMQLRDRGHFDLDDDVSNYLPFPARNHRHPDKPITFRHLLTHTSSLRDNDFAYSTYSTGDPTITLETFVREYLTPNGTYWKKSSFSKHEPGKREDYSNVGFALLGYLVETISKQPLEAYLRENIYAPLGMLETSFYIANLDASRHAVPYTYARKPRRKLIEEGDGLLLPGGARPRRGFNGHALYSYPTISDGLVRTSVHQLAAFLMAYMNNGSYNGKRILKPETIEEMLTVQVGREQGLGWFRSNACWGHDGGDPGCATEMLFDRGSRIGIIIFCNADTNGLEPIKKLLFEMGSRLPGTL